MKVLEVLMGLFLIYLIFAIVVSGIQEWWAQYRGHRGDFLRTGLLRLIGDESIFVRVLQHPLIGSLYRDRAARGKPPSYIDPNNFALAFAQVVIRRAGASATTTEATRESGGSILTFDRLRHALTDLAAQRSLVAAAALPIVDQAQGNLDIALKGISAWYAGGMDRVSGWYKAYAQRRLFVIGFLVACLANVNTLEIYHALSRSTDLRTQLADMADTVGHTQKIGDVDLGVLNTRELTAEESQAVLKAALSNPAITLPIGYGCLVSVNIKPEKRDTNLPSSFDAQASSSARRCLKDLRSTAENWGVSDWLSHVLGWGLTALAGVLGAPYWFAALTKIVGIRGSGPKPKKTQE